MLFRSGLVRWFLSLHSPVHNYSISPEKVGGSSKDSKKKPADKDALPVFGGQSTSLADISSVPPTTVLESDDSSDEIAMMPPMFTPSIRKTLNKPGAKSGSRPVPLPENLGVSVLKSRLDGKKKIKYVLIHCVGVISVSCYRGAFLTPKEMEDLTECWKPYRSVGEWSI